MKKFAGVLILLIVGALLSCPKPADSTSPSKAWVVSTLTGGGASARFILPSGVAVDASGNVYVADQRNHLIRKITPDGVVSTLASGSASTQFNYPTGVAVDASGNVYVADYANHRIRKITLEGRVDTLASGSASAQFNYPTGVAVDASDNVYVADSFNHRIRKITAAGEVSTLAGTGESGSMNGDGITEAQFNYPRGVAVDAEGNLYVTDEYNHLIRKITAAGEVSTLAGTGESGSMNGEGITEARFNSPTGVAVDAEGNVYVADTSNHLIRKITAAGEVSTLAGTGESGSMNGDGITEAQFNYPRGVAVDAEGNLYVADTSNHLIRKIEYKLP